MGMAPTDGLTGTIFAQCPHFGGRV